MKIDLDLYEIFDEGENIEDSIKERIIQTIINRIYNKIEKDASKKINETLTNGIKEVIDKLLPELVLNIMNYEFEETNCYGSTTGGKTTVKNKILKVLEKECKFENRAYRSDMNAFTRALADVVETKMKDFKTQFDKEVNSIFVKEAFEYAQNKIKEKLGIK